MFLCGNLMWLTMKGRMDEVKGESGRRERGEQGGKRVRQCEVTRPPLAVRCLPRTGAVARSDNTPLKQKALVI